MSGLVKGLIVNADGTARFAELKDELQTYYDVLHCDTIEIPRLDIGGIIYNVVCDEEALCKDERPNPTVFDCMGNPMIFGSVFICKNEGPELSGISKEDERVLADNLRLIVVKGEIRVILFNAQYPKMPLFND